MVPIQKSEEDAELSDQDILAKLMKAIQGGGIRPPEALYHYTTPVGLKGIVESKQVWASSIHYMNDSSEFEHALDLAGRAIQSEIDARNDTSEISALERMREQIEPLRYRPVFVASFSANGDLLSQWRAYCGHAGFSLGFDPDELTKCSAKFVLAPCFYSPAMQKTVIRGLVDTCLKHFANSRRNAEDLGALGMAFFRGLTSVAPLLKHPGFEEEQEWRMICTAQSFAPADLQFRPGQTMLVPYVALTIEKEDKSTTIDRLIVGPNPHPELAMLSAKSLLEKHLITVPILYSEVPYRSW